MYGETVGVVKFSGVKHRTNRLHASSIPPFSAVLDTYQSAGLTTDMDPRELSETARMARLTLSPEEMKKLGKAVEQMLQHFSHMKEIDVEGLAPTTHALLRENRTRDDVERAPDVSGALLKNAPQLEERFIVIPNVL
jgi:aspartyl-tRNA(Asn)/glutamyl-tRNA(Gln) amidotransferase subunit C